MRLDTLPAGIAGDASLIFVGLPLAGCVAVFRRGDGVRVGTLPAPSGGFRLPFVLHQLGEGALGVLDAGGLPSPSPFVPVSPTLHAYRYEYDVAHGFRATCTTTVSFEGHPVGFAEDFVALGDGEYAVSDAVLGAIWRVRADGRITPALTNAAQAHAVRLSCSEGMPRIDVDGVPFLFFGATLPGVSPMALRAGLLYFYVPSAGGLYAIPLSSLSDARDPASRIADARLISPRPAGVAVEQLLGLCFHPDPQHERYLYAADSLQQRIVRIDVVSGHREVIAADAALLAFPSSLGFVPTEGGRHALLVVSNQQHRMALTNHAIDADQLVVPFLLAEIALAV